MAQIMNAQTIVSLFRNVLDPTGTRHIEWKKPIGYYVPGGPGALPAFADYLNKSPQFRGYHLALDEADVQSVKSVEDMVSVIIGSFQEHGWTVIA
jgi:hypothetical protein